MVGNDTTVVHDLVDDLHIETMNKDNNIIN